MIQNYTRNSEGPADEYVSSLWLQPYDYNPEDCIQSGNILLNWKVYIGNINPDGYILRTLPSVYGSEII